MAVDPLTEVRLRLDVTTSDVSDARLTHFLSAAVEAVDRHVPSYNRAAFGYQEGVIQLAVKMYDTSARGTVALDPTGEYVAPSPSATKGLILSVWGLIGPLAEPGFA